MNETILNQTLSEPDIISRILDGESALYELIIRRHNPYLYKVGRCYGFCHEDTEDLMQETYLSAFQYLASFENRSSVKTWLVKILVNHCYHRKQSYRHQHEKPADIIVMENVQPMFSENDKGPERVMINNELRQVIETAIRQIPESYREVFSLRELAGLSTAETSDVLQLSEANVKVRLIRAKSMLRKEIEKMYSPDEIFEFNLVYCDRIVKSVMGHLENDN